MLLLARVLLVIGLVTCCVALRAQYVQLTTNPSSLLFGVVKLEAEVPLAYNFAIEPEAAFLVEGRRFWSNDYDTEGVRFGVVGKKYLNAERPHDGWYGMAYLRASQIDFVDFVDEGDAPNQRDFERARTTFGIGIGRTAVGRDGFAYGFSLGLGRHFVDDKDYTTEPTKAVGGQISDSDDSEILDFPMDVYGRVYVGLRLFTRAGRVARDAYDELKARRRAEEEAALREQIERQRERVLKRGRLD